MRGKIIKLTGGFYYIKSGDVVLETRARGNFRKTKVETIVGDDVEWRKNSGIYWKSISQKKYAHKTKG